MKGIIKRIRDAEKKGILKYEGEINDSLQSYDLLLNPRYNSLKDYKLALDQMKLLANTRPNPKSSGKQVNDELRASINEEEKLNQ
jgi:hypothetical protein